MAYFIKKDGAGRVIVHIQADIESIDGYELTDQGPDVLWKKWNGNAWVDGKNRKEKAFAELAKIDADSGMSRSMRETLIAIGAEKVPQSVKDFEAAAAVERAALAA